MWPFSTSQDQKKKPKIKKPEKPWTELLKEIVDTFGQARIKRKKRSRVGRVNPDVVRSFVTPTVYAMIVDEERQAQEEMLLLTMLMSSPVLRDLTPDEFGILVHEVEMTFPEVYSHTFEADMLKRLNDMPQDLRLSTYAFAVRMVFADQTQSPEEERALKDLQKWLEIGRGEADQIHKVMQSLTRAAPTN